MTKTRSDVIGVALQRINVAAVGETPAAEDAAEAGTVLDSVFEEMKTVQGFNWAWALSAVPDALLVPLGYYLATQVATRFGARMPESPERAMARIRAYHFTDDREDRADLDDSGTVSDSEADADARAVFY